MSWPALESWQRVTGASINAFEAETVITLSRVYVNMGHEARKKDCPAPNAGPATAKQKQAVNNKLFALLGGHEERPAASRGMRKK